MIATIVDTDALLKVVAYSLGAGVGVTLAFSVAIYGATRSNEYRAVGRPAVATALGVLAGIALAACAAAVVLGFIVMTQKS